MKLNELKQIHNEFTVAGLTIRASEFDATRITFAVKDAGGLQVGSFYVEFDDLTDIDYFDTPEYPNTLERLRKTGESNAISRNVNKTITSMSD